MLVTALAPVIGYDKASKIVPTTVGYSEGDMIVVNPTARAGSVAKATSTCAAARAGGWVSALPVASPSTSPWSTAMRSRSQPPPRKHLSFSPQ